MLMESLGGARLRCAAACFAAAMVLFTEPASASYLLVPNVGAPETAMAGANVARPLSPEFAADANPAGFSALGDKAFSLSLGFALGDTEFSADVPEGYTEDNAFVATVPGFGAVLARREKWTLGIALNGSVGSSFNFDPDPEVGVNDGFYSELSVITLAPTLAYKANEQWSFGFSLTPLFGYARANYNLAFPTKYTMRGPGIQAVFGAKYDPSPRLSFGLGVKTPGIVFMEGSAPTPGGRSDTKVDLEMPLQVNLGGSFDLTETLEVAIATRFTNSSSFGRSDVAFEDLPAANVPLFPAANDELRFALGLAWTASERLILRGGLGYADGIIGDKGANPLIFDVGDDLKVSGGFSWDFGDWIFDTSAGYNFSSERRIEPEDALIFPGRYKSFGGILQFGLRRDLP